MKILKAGEVAQVDKDTIEKTGIPSLVLMENAGRSCAEIILREFFYIKNISVVAGSGNNGGDGVVVARYLHRAGKNVKLFILAENEEKLSKDNKFNLDIFKKFSNQFYFITEKDLGFLKENLSNCDLIVDAIFGTGFKPPVSGYRKEVIQMINSLEKNVVCIDIPSGIDADNPFFEVAVKGKITITFGYPKICHILYPSGENCGKVYVVDIGLDDSYAPSYRQLITPYNIQLPKREKTGNKYTFGHVAIIGGSVGKSGAVIMAAKASTASGSGLTTVMVPSQIHNVVETNLIEEMSIPIEDHENTFSVYAKDDIPMYLENRKISSVVLGMGLSVNDITKNLVKELLKVEKPLVIDADGLNNLAQIENYKDLLKERKYPAILTPHTGEFSRLTGLDTNTILQNVEEIGKKFSQETNSYLILKFSRMVIFTLDGKIFYCNRGNPGMATAGTG
ncbi:NAD(P)H-hydrate epimerase, partial [Sulfurihydrogenibium sp.]|uniref:NAD(P)H-hydrate epimerase n=1 Tax=Sulfurihydrogenibium sp. TaxID=2053621 RepID=UPI0026047028